MGLGDIASIATLILFVFYFVGRVLTIIRNRDIFSDELKIESADFNKEGIDIVETFDIEDNPYNAFILTSKQGIYDLTVYKIIYDDKFNRIKRIELKEYKYGFLNLGQSLEFRITSPEFLTTYEVEYYTPDYKRVTIALWDNPKNGVMSESANPKNTFRSIMFHLFN